MTRPVYTLPQVDLLPPEIAAARRLRRAQSGLGALVLGAVGIVALLYVGALHGVTDAQTDLDAANAQQQQVQGQVSEFADVRQTYAKVAASETMLTRAMGKEVRWSHYLTDLSLTIPPQVWVTNVTVAQTVDGVAGATSGAAPAGAAETGIGTVTFSGTAYSHDDVAAWLESLATEKGYTNPYFTTSTERFIGPKKVVDFASTVTVTPDAYEGRYAEPGGVTP